MKYDSVGSFLSQVALRNPGQPEFLQAVTEVMESLWPFIEKNPRYAEQGLLERLVEPERVVMFRVSWTDDHGTVQVNRGYREARRDICTLKDDIFGFGSCFA